MKLFFKVAEAIIKIVIIGFTALSVYQNNFIEAIFWLLLLELDGVKKLQIIFKEEK